ISPRSGALIGSSWRSPSVAVVGVSVALSLPPTMIASRRASSSRFWGRSPPRMSEVFISLQLVQRVHHRVSSLPGAGPVGSCRWWHLFLVPAPELPQAVWRRPHSRVGRGKDTSDRSPDNFRYPDEKFPSSSPQGNPPAR